MSGFNWSSHNFDSFDVRSCLWKSVLLFNFVMVQTNKIPHLFYRNRIDYYWWEVLLVVSCSWRSKYWHFLFSFLQTKGLFFGWGPRPGRFALCKKLNFSVRRKYLSSKQLLLHWLFLVHRLIHNFALKNLSTNGFGKLSNFIRSK